jgi:class 3 adenylate cyclase/tetratricopeptide (TPR) repeat protein
MTPQAGSPSPGGASGKRASCPSCGEVNPERARFCLSCGAAIAEPRPAREVRKTVTTLFCDVVESSVLGEQADPELVRRVLSRFFDEMRAVIERHGGTVEKFIGDEVMAVFGVPITHEDDAVRAVRAAAEMRSRLRRLNEEFEREFGVSLVTRMGINTGEVVAGDPSSGQAFVTGDSVNLAKRIQQAARPGEILIGTATYPLVKDAVEAGPPQTFSVKGKAEPVAPRRLGAVDATAPGLARRFDAPLVGRDRELGVLRRSFEDTVRTRSSRLVTVLGPAGIGKSRLAHELLAEVRERATTLVGRCLPYGEGITFWPVREMLPDESLQGTRDEIFWRVRKRLETMARERPLVVCLEDVHWGEPTFLDLVQYLAGWLDDSPVLIVCLARPDLLDQRPDWPKPRARATALHLEPLTSAEAESLLDALNALAGLRTRIAAAAEGNPLFVEQMAALTAEDPFEIVVPPSIKALLAERLDRLSTEESAVLARAAVVGREFRLRAVLHLLPDDQTLSASAHLLALARKELVEPHAVHDDGFRFNHALIRDAAYEGMPKELRAELHEKHAAWLERAGEADVFVGYHLEQAVALRRELKLRDQRTSDLAGRAGELLGAAGRRAFRRDDVPAAVNLLERTARVLPDDSGTRPALFGELGSALIKAGRLDDAGEALESAVDGARRAGDRSSELRATVDLHLLRSFTAPSGTEELARVAAEVIPELERLQDDLGLAKAWRLFSGVYVVACRWADRAEALQRALDYARRVPDAPHERSSIVSVLAQALYYGPELVAAAVNRCEELLREAQNDPTVRAGVACHLGGLRAQQGDFASARRLYGESVELHDELGLRFRRAVIALVGAEIAMLEDDPGAAEQELRAAYETLDAMGESGARAAIAAALADLLCTRGDEAAAGFARTVEEIAEGGDVFPQVLRRATVARLLARSGDLGRATSVVSEAVALADATDFPALQATTFLAQAEVAALAGAEDSAHGALEHARRAYLAKGNLVAARRVDRIISQPLSGVFAK